MLIWIGKLVMSTFLVDALTVNILTLDISTVDILTVNILTKHPSTFTVRCRDRANKNLLNRWGNEDIGF
jgi:hypothetical protein